MGVNGGEDIKLIKDHSEEHPIRERELREFGRGSSWVEFGNKVSYGFKNNKL